MRKKSRWRLAELAVTFTASSAAPVAAEAEPATSAQVPARLAPADVRIACPTLTPAERASLEARVLAELAMKRISEGHLEIRCEAKDAIVDYSMRARTVRRASTPLPAETRLFAESILPLVDQITSDSTLGPPPLATFEPAPLAPRAAPAPAPAAESPPVPPRRPRPRSQPPPAREAVHDDASTTEMHEQRFTLLPAFGVRSEIAADFGRASEPLLLGPGAALGLDLPLGVRLEAMASLTWSVETIRGIGVRHFTSGLHANVGGRLFLGAGAYVSWSHFFADAALSPESRNLVDPAFGLRTGYELSIATHSFVPALGFIARPRYHDVRINGEPVFRMSSLSMILTVEYRVFR
jgi:hypothetical protein